MTVTIGMWGWAAVSDRWQVAENRMVTELVPANGPAAGATVLVATPGSLAFDPDALEALVDAAMRSGDEALVAAVLKPVRLLLGEALENAAILAEVMSLA